MSDPVKDFQLGSFLPYRLAVAAEALSSGLAKRYKADFGISVADWRVLVHIADAGEVSIREIHTRVHLEKSKASRAATRLEAAGYLTKETNTEDRRLVALKLTPQGRELMDQLLALATAYQSKLDALLGSQKKALNEALDLLLQDDL